MTKERNELAEEVTEIIDHGDLHGNPIPVVSKKEEVVKGPDPELLLMKRKNC
jgi:hypothetical protein